MRNFFLLILCLLAACCWAQPQVATSDHSTPAMHLDKATLQADGVQVKHVTNVPKTVHGGAFEVGFANTRLIAADVPSVHVRSYMAEGAFSPDRLRPCVVTDAVTVSMTNSDPRSQARLDLSHYRTCRRTSLRWMDLQRLVQSPHPTSTARLTTSAWSA